jgi:putative peptidoglycan lipid II flippase
MADSFDPVINLRESAGAPETQPLSAPDSPLNSVTAALKRTNPHRDIMTAAMTIAVLTAIVRLASVAKELNVAWRFGTSDDLDAFLISVLVPTAIVAILASSFNASVIPIYIETKEHEGSAAAERILQSATAWVILCLIPVAALVVFAAPVYLRVLGSAFSHDKLQFTLKLVCVTSVVVVLGGVGALWTSVLNAERRFAVTAVTPLATPLITLGFLWWAPGWRTASLVAGMIVGSATEMLLLGYALRKLGLSLQPRWPRIDSKIRRLGGQFLPVAAGSILNSGNFMVDSAMAAMLAAGSVASLNYGNRIIQLPIVLLSAPLGTALMPYLSRLAAARDWPELRRTVRRFIGLSFFFTLPLTAGLIIFSRPIVSILYQRGAFTAADVLLVSRVQAFYALEIPSYVVSIVVVRLISSLQSNQLLLFATIINLVINVSLNFVFMRWLGVPGLALSTSIVYLFSTVLCYVVIMRRLQKLSGTN